MDFVGLDKMSLLDYEDRVSCVLFTKACNFRCPFCHNGLTVLESNDSISFEEVMKFLKSRVGLLDAVVISGGEPTLMPDLKEKIVEIKKLGFEIKLDTNGYNPSVLKDLVNSGLIDYVAMDIKDSPKMYPEITNVPTLDINKIKESISFLKENKVPYEFRTTLVKEYHSEQDIFEMGELIKGADKIYLQKFVDREGVIKKGLHEIKKETVDKYKKILQQFVKIVELRGY